MANVAHSSLTGSNLHENKGAAAAADNTVATVLTGATVWQKLTASNLTGTGNSFGGQVLHLKDQRTSGTAGQTYPTPNSWATKVLNTTAVNDLGGSYGLAVSPATTNQILLQAGTYWADVQINYDNSTNSQTQIYNVTDGATLLFGTSNNGSSGNSQSHLHGRFTLAAQKIIEVRIYLVGTSVTTGISTGVGELYANVVLRKTA